MLNREALTEILDKAVNRIRYAIDQNDRPLLEFSIGELEDIIHNLKLDLKEKTATYQAPTEEEILAQQKFMGKFDE
jgi:hypothetical protein